MLTLDDRVQSFMTAWNSNKNLHHTNSQRYRMIQLGMIDIHPCAIFRFCASLPRKLD